MTQLSSFFHGDVSICRVLPKTLCDKHGVSVGGLAALRRPKSGTVAWHVDNMSCWHWREEGAGCRRLKVNSAPPLLLLLSAASEVPSLASASSVLSSCCVHPPQSEGEGSLNSHNPARHQFIFSFIKGAAALLLGRNDSYRSLSHRLSFLRFQRCHKRENT